MNKHLPMAHWDPFAGLLNWQDDVRDLFRDFYGATQGPWSGKGRDGAAWMPAVDIEETEQAYLVSADLPGVDQKDVKVSLENQMLSIRGERRAETDESRKGRHRVERAWGVFERTFTLPHTVDAEHVKAAYKDGVLTITLPKREGARQKLIEVKVG